MTFLKQSKIRISKVVYRKLVLNIILRSGLASMKMIHSALPGRHNGYKKQFAPSVSDLHCG